MITFQRNTMYTKLFLVSLFIFTVLSQKDPHFIKNRATIVHLFEWKWLDIANECENFLQHAGFAGVQISPPNEHANTPSHSWWERYQPVSYKIISRSGTEDEFRNMTKRCNQVGVRIYADVVINHMADTKTPGYAGSPANIQNKSYPSVPYGPNDFHWPCDINNFNDAGNVRNCQLGTLPDLNQSSEYVQGKIIDFLNHLIDLGVAGFRIDAAKHMWPKDLEKIYKALKNLNVEHGFQADSKPFIYQEVTEAVNNQGSKFEDYVNLGAVTEFKFSRSISNVFKGNDKLTYLSNWGQGWGFWPNGSESIVFVDNHDTQRDNSLSYKNAKQYKMANAFMLAHPYGRPKIMSSFAFKDRNDAPPEDAEGHLLSPDRDPKVACTIGFVTEHRWRQIYSMVQFRNVVQEEEIKNWWSNGDQQISFCRGNKGFVAFTNWGDLIQRLQTCLPEGIYCDVISGKLEERKCSGKSVIVAKDGFADVKLLAIEQDGMIAIHINSKLT